LQNGVDATRELASVLGRDPVLVGLCGTISWVSGPGHIRSIGTSNFIRFGEQDNNRSRRVETILQALVGAGINAEVPRDIHQALWTKFLVVTAVGGVGALSRAPIGVTRSLPETRKLLEACMAEVRAVAIAHGINLPEAVIPGMMEYLDGLAPSSTTSLQRDIADGKRTELDYWNGAVVRLAASKDVAVPTHKMIYDLLLPLHRQAMGELNFPR
jgi:2-dehydropantoate 2-reductase